MFTIWRGSWKIIIAQENETRNQRPVEQKVADAKFQNIGMTREGDLRGTHDYIFFSIEWNFELITLCNPLKLIFLAYNNYKLIVLPNNQVVLLNSKSLYSYGLLLFILAWIYIYLIFKQLTWVCRERIKSFISSCKIFLIQLNSA